MAFSELRKSSDYGFSKKVWIAELSFATTDALGLKNIYIFGISKNLKLNTHLHMNIPKV
jgi:hypothetical protein